jgi:hypothetical protein
MSAASFARPKIPLDARKARLIDVLERHRELKEWIAYDFDPDIVDIEGLAEQLAALAKRWSRHPAPRRPRRG